MKGKRWLLWGVIGAAVLCLWLFRGEISIHTAPGVVLYRAMAQTLDEMEAQLEGSLPQMLFQLWDPQGNYTWELTLDTRHKTTGPVRYDMTVYTCNVPRKIQAQGTLASGGRVAELDLFLGPDYAALSSSILEKGRHYGISYDSFSQDLRENQLLSLFLTEKTLSSWEASVAALQNVMTHGSELQKPDLQYLRSALPGLLLFKPEISHSEDGHALTLCMTGAELADMAAPYLQKLSTGVRSLVQAMGDDPEAGIQGTFSVTRGTITAVTGTVTLNGCCYGLDLSWKDDLLEAQWRAPEGICQFSWNRKAEQEWVQLSGSAQPLRLEGVWNRATGELRLCCNETPLRLNLQAEGEGLKLYTQEFGTLLGTLTQIPSLQEGICTLHITPGIPKMDPPDYCSFGQWSLEDLLKLLQGFGSLLGLKIQ